MRWQWVHSELPSVQACRRSCLPGVDVELQLDASGQANARGLRTCGSVWACPLCSATIWADRASQLRRLLKAAEHEGLRVGFITLTMRHSRWDRLSDLWQAMAPALTAALGAGSREVRRIRRELGVWGVVRRTEATYGENGWHLHPHLLVFAERGEDGDFEALASAMFDAWQAKIVRHGLPAPSDDNGWHVKLLDLSHAEEEAARYVTTAGSFHAAAELADRGGKTARFGNRTTWQLLADARDGDRRAAERWAEWELTSKGRCAWDCRSPRLRRLAEGYVEDEPDKPDERETVVTLREPEWAEVCRERSVSELLTAAEEAYRLAVVESAGDREAGLQSAAWAVTMLLFDWGVWSAVTGQGPPGAGP